MKQNVYLRSDELICRRDLDDKLRLANQHAQTKHTTLSIAMSTRQIRISSFWRTLAHRVGQVDRARLVGEKNVPNTWSPSTCTTRERENRSKHVVVVATLLSDLTSAGEAFIMPATLLTVFCLDMTIAINRVLNTE